MSISAKDVAALRIKTGLGMMECKQALEETGGDSGKALDLLRQKGLAKMDGRVDRTSAEGRIAVAVNAARTCGAVIEINTETDFTAKNEAFNAMVARIANEAVNMSAGEVAKSAAMQTMIDDVRLITKENVQFGRGRVIGGAPDSRVGAYVHFTGKVGVLVELQMAPGATIADELLTDLCLQVAAGTPTIALGVNESDIDPAIVAKEKEIAKAQGIESGKPEAIAEKMVIGKLRKFFEDNCLNLQPFIKDDKKRIKEVLPKGVTIKSFVRYQVGVK